MIITHNTTNYLNMTLLQRNHSITNIYNNMSLRNITFCNFRELYILTVYFPFFCSKQSWSINYLESLFQILRAINGKFVGRLVIINLHVVFQSTQ